MTPNVNNAAVKVPLVFIASSSEGKTIAEAISQNLGEVCECKTWSNGMFEPGSFYLETLLKNMPDFDFAVMVMTNDDKLIVRGNDYSSPRDNVLFELGMYIGSLGRDRTFIIKDRSVNLKMPSDLDGLTTGSFTPPQRTSIRDAVASACIDIKNAIRRLGVKNAPAPEPAEDQDCFPKGVHTINDVGKVLDNKIEPILKAIINAGQSLKIKNFGLDLRNVMTWMEDKADSGFFNNVPVSIECLVINPDSTYLKDMIDNGSNIKSASVQLSIASAKGFKDKDDLKQFQLEMRQYDLPPVAHGFIINDAHVFLGFTEVKNGKIIGGIKPYIHLDIQQDYFTSPIVQHYFNSFKTWFEAYWNISKTVADVKK